MYEEYFALKEAPFSIAPDPRYLYMSEGHQEALAHLLYGISNDGGFVLLTGEVGTGKTTVCRRFLDQAPEDTDVAFILNPRVTVEELLAAVCDELGIGYPPSNTSVKVFVDLINEYLLDAHARGRRTVVIVEEAQNLGFDVLEQLRLLTNLETNRRKLLQIIMLGQPELREMLERRELRQLAQRITARYHLGPIPQSDLPNYVSHRLSVAGVKGRLFPPSIMGKLYRMSGGIPRLINVLCDRALLGAYVKGLDGVDKETLAAAGREVLGGSSQGARLKNVRPWLIAGIVVLSAAVAFSSLMFNRPHTAVPAGSAGKAAATGPAVVRLPAERPADANLDAAFPALFRQWNAVYTPNDRRSACAQAASQGLRCFKKRDSLAGLLKMKSPAVLKLYDNKRREYYATLVAQSGEKATLVVGGSRIETEVGEVALHWSGEYTVLWRPPSGYPGNLRKGDNGPVVEWLGKRLALIEGSPDSPVGTVFDEALKGRVRAFQQSRGLRPDGEAGPETMIHIGAATGADVAQAPGGKGRD